MIPRFLPTSRTIGFLHGPVPIIMESAGSITKFSPYRLISRMRTVVSESRICRAPVMRADFISKVW